MANKTVENPCIGTGTPTKGSPQIIKNKVYAQCSVCEKMVSITKASHTARKHNGVYQPTLWDTFDEDIIFGRPDGNKEQNPVGAGSL